MKRKIRSILIEILASTLGNILVLLHPKKARQMSEKGMTVVFNLSLSERLMRRAILKNLEKKEDYDTLAEFHQNFWAQKGSDFFATPNNSFENIFLPECSFIFKILKEEILNHSEKFNTLVEIGTGNGKVLEYLSSEFPDIKHFVGVDLNAVQIDINNKRYHKNKRLDFIASDGFDWVKRNGRGNTIFVTQGGVLEYFTKERLQTFLEEINILGKIIFIAIEPNDIKHNFETTPNSQPYGHERSFSHNYPKLFKDTGFKVWHFSQKPWPGLEGTNNTFIGAVS